MDIAIETEFVKPDQIDIKKQVVISLPYIFIHTNDVVVGLDESTSNLRVVDVDKLESFYTMGLSIDTTPANKQSELTALLIQTFIDAKTIDNSTLMDIFKLINYVNEGCEQLYVKDSFDSLDYDFINFDHIYNYKTDPETSVLKEIEITPIDGKYCWSELGFVNEDLKQKLNDTLHNRIQLILKKFTESLMFKTDRICDSTIKYTNICLFMAVLLNYSKPIANYCINSLLPHYLSLLTYNLFQSRIIQAWQIRTENNTKLAIMADISRNYDSKSLFVEMCKLTTPKERAMLLINKLANTPNNERFAELLNYNMFIDTLKKYIITINDVDYYDLSHNFICELFKEKMWEELRSLSLDTIV